MSVIDPDNPGKPLIPWPLMTLEQRREWTRHFQSIFDREKVGEDVIRDINSRLKLRIPVVHLDSGCALCLRASERGNKKAVIGNVKVSVCPECASIGKLLLAEGVPIRDCLVIAAENIAVEYSRDDIEAIGKSMKPRPHISRAMLLGCEYGSYKAVCECNSCTKLRGYQFDSQETERRVAEFQADPLNAEIFSVVNEMRAEQAPGNFTPEERKARLDANQAATRYPGMKPGGLAERALSKGPIYGPNWSEQQSKGDADDE